LQQLFPSNHDSQSAPQVNWQMLAAANACLNRFSVITGGPGTGKTTTVTRLLAALISEQPNLRVALAAPTGKAAARLVESILAAKSNLAKTFPLAEKIPVTSFTLHRLLGWRPDGFSYNHKKTLPYDLVIVDEASMVDLPMMAQLIEALGDNTRLILLGDKDQLASVEAGSVLGDLCDSGIKVNDYPAHGLTSTRATQLEQLCGFSQGQLNEYIEPNAPLMANSLAQLRVSYRFTHDSGIGKLASAVNLGRSDQVEQSFQGYADIQRFTSLAAPFNNDKSEALLTAENAWQQQVIQGYGYYLSAIEQELSPFEVLQLFNKFQLLCALRKGSSGLHALNDRVQKLLQGRGLLNVEVHSTSLEQNRWYVGRPVMISRNDYELNLFNGDIGIAMMVDVDGTAKKELRVCFMASDSDASQPKIRQLLPTRLPEHETAFAMTVHKSQGSEFEDVALVLPETYSPVISRELIYTAITRAKKTFSLYSNQEVLERGVSSRIERASGLRDLLF
jgi:exodeoxyribonuclease V alpha subunit